MRTSVTPCAWSRRGWLTYVPWVRNPPLWPTPARAPRRTTTSAVSVGPFGIARVEAQRSYREATADATAFFRASLGLAREEYRKELVGAKSDYRAATSVASVEAA